MTDREGAYLNVTSVNVLYTPGGTDWGIVPPRLLDVDGSDEEFLSDALTRALGEAASPLLVVDIDEDGRDEYVLGTLDELTMAQAARFADGATLHLSVIGVGGGIVPTVLELVLGGLTLMDAVDRVRRGAVVVSKFRNRDRRAAATRWVIDGRGEPSSILRRMVYQYPRWRLADFEHAFGLETGRAADLFRAVGYVEVSTEPSIWAEVEDA